MSAFADDADDFLGFARSANPDVTGGSFVPRSLYGSYLAHLLDEAETRSTASLRRIAGEATSVDVGPDGLVRVGIDGVAPVVAERVVLAIGNFPPSDPAITDPAFYSDPRYARDPWAADALEGDPDQQVLLIGTGLTMLDIALALRDRGQRALIHGVSRHGLLPHSHRVAAVAPPHYPRPAGLDGWPRSAVGLLQRLRAEVDDAAESGIDWREVHTSLRADTPALWMSLSETEKERFLRHARPYWETHRHRSSPQTAAAIQRLLLTERLRVVAASVVGFEPAGELIDARLRPRGQRETTAVSVGRVVNCTGPDTDVRRVAEPLVQQLLANGLVTPDPLGLGLRSGEYGGLIDAAGRASERLFLVGPLRKGLLWENTAVPELRVEAEHMARHLSSLAS